MYSRLSPLLLVALTAIGCAHLPYILADKRDNIVGVEIALQPDAASTQIALVRGFIRSSDIDELQAVVVRVMETTKFENFAQTADASPALQRLEERIVSGFRPFATYPNHDKAIEFIQTPDNAPMSDETILSIERYVPDASGVRFRPRAPGAAPPQTTSPVTSRAAGVAAYQIGAAGKAERLLWTWRAAEVVRRP